MIERSFSLLPFPALKHPEITIAGKVSFENRFLSLHYRLAGDIKRVLLPPVSGKPGRRDELWKTTCFEFFLAVEAQPGYWEFNLSPSGDWNVYRMDAYRRVNFHEETSILQLPFAFKADPDQYSLDISLDLSPLIQPGEVLQMAITAIIQTTEGDESYWALSHPAPQADFHLRESFILRLAGQTHPSAQSAPGG